MDRREILAGVGATLTAVAGCAGYMDGTGETPTSEATPTATDAETVTATDTATPTETTTHDSWTDPEELDGFIRPDGNREIVPDELVCDDDAFERQKGWIDPDALQWGNLTNEDGRVIFALRVDARTVDVGAEVTFTLTNVSGEGQRTGNLHKSNFEVYTNAGWQAPRGWDDGQPKPVTDDPWNWDPGKSRELTLEMTERGVVEDGYRGHRDSLVTCPGLPPGRYRFATAAPDQGDVGIAFDLTE